MKKILLIIPLLLASSHDKPLIVYKSTSPPAQLILSNSNCFTLEHNEGLIDFSWFGKFHKKGDTILFRRNDLFEIFFKGNSGDSISSLKIKLFLSTNISSIESEISRLPQNYFDSITGYYEINEDSSSLFLKRGDTINFYKNGTSLSVPIKNYYFDYEEANLIFNYPSTAFDVSDKFVGLILDKRKIRILNIFNVPYIDFKK